MNHNNETKVRIVADQLYSYQQFETMTYPLLQCNSDRSHFLLFHHNQAGSMLKIRMDRDNSTKVRVVVANQSNQQFETMIYHLLQYNSLL